MKATFKTTAVLMFIIISLVSCVTNNSRAEQPTEFWETSSDFTAPADWKTYTYADAFSIQIPSYMREVSYSDPNDILLDKEPLEAGCNAIRTFSARNDSAHNSYARIAINYMKGNTGDFLGYLDRADLDREDSKMFCDNLIKSQLGSGVLIKILEKDFTLTSECNMMLDLCYQRAGNTEGEGPVTVHIFYLQHTDEAVCITVSYHDKNKDAYKDLFNIVETLKWTNFKSSNTSANI